jgi:hypothetical protein
MTFDEEHGRMWRPGDDEIRLVAGGLPIPWRFDWRSFLLGIGVVVFVIILAVVMLSFGSGAPPSATENETPTIVFYRADKNAMLWRCECLPPPEEPIHLGGVDTGIYGYGTEGAEEMNRIGMIAGGHEFVRCTPVEDKMPLVTFKVQDPDKFCLYHDHEVEESRVYIGLEEHGPICAEAAEELAGPLVLEGTDE